MKRIESLTVTILATLLAMLSGMDCSAAVGIVPEGVVSAAPDSSALKALSSKLETYVKAIETLSFSEQAAGNRTEKLRFLCYKYHP